MGFRRSRSLDIFNGVLSSRAADESLLWTLRHLSRSCPAPGAHRVVPHSFPVTPHHLSSALPFVRDCQRCRQHGCLAQPSGAAEGAGRNRLEPAGTGWDRLGPAACSAGWPPACPTERLQPPWCQCPAGHGLSDLWQSLKAQGTTPSPQGVMDLAKPLRTRDKMGENTGNMCRTWPPPELPGAAAGGNQIQLGNQLPDKAGSWCKFSH